MPLQKRESVPHTYTLLMFDQTGCLKMITSGLFYGCKLYSYVTECDEQLLFLSSHSGENGDISVGIRRQFHNQR